MVEPEGKSSVETYEQLYTQLEDLVKRLEGEVLPLDELLRLYEEGVRLVTACQQLLNDAELRVRQLQDLQDK